MHSECNKNLTKENASRISTNMQKFFIRKAFVFILPQKWLALKFQTQPEVEECRSICLRMDQESSFWRHSGWFVLPCDGAFTRQMQLFLGLLQTLIAKRFIRTNFWHITALPLTFFTRDICLLDVYIWPVLYHLFFSYFFGAKKNDSGCTTF